VLARQHNDANVCSLGARFHSDDEAAAIVERFVTTDFSEEARHVRRIAQVRDYDLTGALSPSDD